MQHRTGGHLGARFGKMLDLYLRSASCLSQLREESLRLIGNLQLELGDTANPIVLSHSSRATGHTAHTH